MSVKERHFETANVLLERGADVNARGKVCAARVNMRIYELYNDKRRCAAVQMDCLNACRARWRIGVRSEADVRLRNRIGFTKRSN